MQTLTIRMPDDCHLHLRDGELLKRVVNHSAQEFARAVVMPNLAPPITTVAQAKAYKQRIESALDVKQSFQALMTLYLTDNTRVEEIKLASKTSWMAGAKLYPAGVTTNADAGVSSVTKCMPIFEQMAKTGLVLQVHGEVTDPNVDIFDREAVFIEQILMPLSRELPELKIVLEHVTTQQGVEFVLSSNEQIAATITPQHLLFNRNEIFRGGVRPHLYCLPVLKREQHRAALVQAAISGSDKFFLGTDSAPHLKKDKESACGCAGCYTAHGAMAMMVTLFEQMESLDKLEHFCSYAGANYYGWLPNDSTITLAKQNWMVPDEYEVNNAQCIVPLLAGETLPWRVI